MKRMVYAILLLIGIIVLFVFPVNLHIPLPFNLDDRIIGILIISAVIILFIDHKNHQQFLTWLLSENERLKSLRRDDSLSTAIFDHVQKIHTKFAETHDETKVIELTVEVVQRIFNVPFAILKIIGDEEDPSYMAVERGDSGIDLGEQLITETVEHLRSKLVNHLGRDASFTSI